MREFEYPLARAKRVRARRAGFGGYSLLLCAGLAFIFVAPHESRTPGAAPSPGLEVAPAQAMAPPPRRSVSLPADRVMTASVEILGGQQAADIWSTPFQAEEPAIPVVEAPAPEIQAVLAAAEESPAPSILFEHTSLVDQALPIEGGRAAASPATPSSVPPLSMRSLSGKWAPHPAACSERNKRTAFLPLTIDERGARAGTASCSFRRTDQDGNRWSVNATCTDASETWNAHVRLVLAGSKLTWSSERGTQTYTRCR
jgi:hypothetical protein